MGTEAFDGVRFFLVPEDGGTAQFAYAADEEMITHAVIASDEGAAEQDVGVAEGGIATQAAYAYEELEARSVYANADEAEARFEGITANPAAAQCYTATADIGSFGGWQIDVGQQAQQCIAVASPPREPGIVCQTDRIRVRPSAFADAGDLCDSSLYVTFGENGEARICSDSPVWQHETDRLLGRQEAAAYDAACAEYALNTMSREAQVDESDVLAEFARMFNLKLEEMRESYEQDEPADESGRPASYEEICEVFS